MFDGGVHVDRVASIIVVAIAPSEGTRNENRKKCNMKKERDFFLYAFLPDSRKDMPWYHIIIGSNYT